MVNMENYAADVSSAAMTFQQGRPTAMNESVSTAAQKNW